MARLITSGFESFGTSDLGTFAPDGLKTALATYAVGEGRNGRACKFVSPLSTDYVAMWLPNAAAFTLTRNYYSRVYFKYDTTQSTRTQIMTARSTGPGRLGSISLGTDDTLQLWNEIAGTQIGSSSYVLQKNYWYMLELRAKLVTGASDELEFRLNETSIASAASLNLTDDATSSRFVLMESGSNTTGTFWFDDYALNDDQGASEATWPGQGSVVFMVPISDSQDGSWTGGAGGTGIDLSLAVSTRPPAGTATETNTTQIESVDTTGDNATDEYRANMTTYTNAGIGSTDTLKLIQLFIAHGEDVATNSKTGSFGMQANPSNAYATFTFGDDSGALSTFPQNISGTNFWRWATQVIYAPSATLGSSPIMAVRKTDNGVRVASVCFMGIYAEIAPSRSPVAGYFDRRTPRRRVQQRI